MAKIVAATGGRPCRWRHHAQATRRPVPSRAHRGHDRARRSRRLALLPDPLAARRTRERAHEPRELVTMAHCRAIHTCRARGDRSSSRCASSNRQRRVRSSHGEERYTAGGRPAAHRTGSRRSACTDDRRIRWSSRPGTLRRDPQRLPGWRSRICTRCPVAVPTRCEHWASMAPSMPAAAQRLE
jgi:hypothetical protein